VIDTSREALASIKPITPTLREEIWEALNYWGPQTCDELESDLELSHQTCSARLRELRLAGRICDTGQRRVTRSGRRAIVWDIVSG
jgi:hypothetical protein